MKKLNIFCYLDEYLSICSPILKLVRTVTLQFVTSILKVLLKQYMSPTGPNKYLRGITTTKTDQLELDLFKVKISKDCIDKSGKLNLRKG